MKLLQVIRTKHYDDIRSFHIIILKIFGRNLIRFSHHWSIYSSGDINGHFSISLDSGMYFALGFLNRDIRIDILETTDDLAYKYFKKEIDILIDL
jgi:hypothetical protein